MILSLSMVYGEVIEIETTADTLVEFAVRLSNSPDFIVFDREYSKGSLTKKVLINKNQIVSVDPAD